MKPSSSNLTLVVIGLVIAYFLSPPLAVKIIEATPLKTSDRFLTVLTLFYYPVIKLGEYYRPYIRLIRKEADLLNTHL